MEVRNVMEDLVETTLADALARTQDVCACERCRCDMRAFALNNLPPRYIVDEPAAVHAYLEAITHSLRADVVYSVHWAVQMVGTRPRHAQSLAGRRSPLD